MKRVTHQQLDIVWKAKAAFELTGALLLANTVGVAAILMMPLDAVYDAREVANSVLIISQCQLDRRTLAINSNYTSRLWVDCGDMDTPELVCKCLRLQASPSSLLHTDILSDGLRWVWFDNP
jgi:hypothetical protein